MVYVTFTYYRDNGGWPDYAEPSIKVDRQTFVTDIEAKRHAENVKVYPCVRHTTVYNPDGTLIKTVYGDHDED
jgi:hypothetical protein